MTAQPATQSPDSQVAPAPPPPAGRQQQSHEPGGYRDTVESILIAFILAFIFRAFVVEAFVIPTGSMAPTLLGAHARFTCPECGYPFEVNFSTGDDQNVQADVRHSDFPRTECPNCAQTAHNPSDKSAQRPPPVDIHYGDRILVLKYAYLFNQPRRWDVVVFKSPDEPAAGTSMYATNFIKRLVGKPGETLMILDGDVYVSTSSGGGGEDLADFKVQSKPRHVQDALWRVVYDNDFLPRVREGGKWQQPWEVEAGEGWDVGTPQQPRRVFTFDAPQGAGTLHFDSEANGRYAFTDKLAYAQRESGRHNVSDAKLTLLYDRASGDGPLRLQLTKGTNAFTAELTPGGARLFHRRGTAAGPDDLGDEVAAATGVPGLAPGGGPVLIDFINVDYGVTLRVAGEDVLAHGYEPDIAALKEDYTANRDQPKPEVRISAANQVAAVSHVSLWRDVYYVNRTGRLPEDILWGRPEPESLIRLGADEYFVLGDNTVISKDARYWNQAIDLPDEDLTAQAGVVPGRFMLGNAFFVYWPAGYRPARAVKLGIIPNFGDMRVIH